MHLPPLQSMQKAVFLLVAKKEKIRYTNMNNEFDGESFHENT